MSGYDNVVGGKLKLKGKALDVKAGGVKKKKKNKKNRDQDSEVTENEFLAGWFLLSEIFFRSYLIGSISYIEVMARII